MAKADWKKRYEIEAHQIILMRGVRPINGLTDNEVPRVEEYLQHRAGEPVYTDKCRYPTYYSPRTYLLNGVAVTLRGRNTHLELSGRPENLAVLITQLQQNPLYLKEVKKKKS